ncbi:MAG: TonB-dependent receptor [Cyanobacteria bacterium J06639_16]
MGKSLPGLNLLALLTLASGRILIAEATLAQPQSEPETLSIPTVESPEEQTSEDASGAASEAIRESSSPPIPLSLSDTHPPATTVTDWVAQIEAALVQITSIRLELTETGLQVLLEATGELAPPTPTVSGNALIVAIPNARLSEPFQEFEPAEGIALVQATTLPSDVVQVAITGNDAPPTVAVNADAANLVLTVVPGVAQAGDSDDAIQIVVTGTEDRYVVPNASTATRTDTPLRDIPQSIQVIPQAVFEDQGITALDDVLRNASGVLQNSADARGQRFVVRGFDSASVLRDGFRPTFGFNGNIGYPELSNIERVEVLKGPAAILYGVSEPGGVINLVSEQPLANPFYEVNFELGSRSLTGGGIDFSGPLTEDGGLLYRLNVLYRDSAFYRDFDTDVERFFIAPVLQWAISDRSDLTLLLEYSDDQRPYDSGLVAIGTEVADIPFTRNLSDPNDINQSTYLRTGYQFEHRFNDDWTFRNAFNYIAYNTIFESSVVLNLNELTGDQVRSYIQLDQPSSTYNVQTNLVGEFTTGSIEHTVLVGVDYYRREAIGNIGQGFATNFVLNIFNPVYGTVPRPDFSTQPIFFDGDSYINSWGIYVQDQITLLDNLHLLAGLRYDTVNQRNVNRPSLFAPVASDTTQNDNAWVPRLGIVYQPVDPISLYASYSQSFAPNSGTTFDGDSLQPERGEQFEVGVRAEALDGSLVASLAYFDITKRNVSTSDPNNISSVIDAGEQRSQGIELDVIGEILPGWNIIANYAYTDARIAADNDGQVGNRLINAPEHSANLWTNYEIQTGALQGLSFGAGVNYVGDRFGDLDNSFRLGNYFLTNAAIAYEQDTWRAAINVRNLFDVNHLTGTRNSRNEIYPGEGLTLVGTFSFEF